MNRGTSKRSRADPLGEEGGPATSRAPQLIFLWGIGGSVPLQVCAFLFVGSTCLRTREHPGGTLHAPGHDRHSDGMLLVCGCWLEPCSLFRGCLQVRTDRLQAPIEVRCEVCGAAHVQPDAVPPTAGGIDCLERGAGKPPNGHGLQGGATMAGSAWSTQPKTNSTLWHPARRQALDEDCVELVRVAAGSCFVFLVGGCVHGNVLRPYLHGMENHMDKDTRKVIAERSKDLLSQP